MHMKTFIGRRDRMQQWWTSLDNTKQLYLAGMIMAGLFVGAIAIAGISLPGDILLMTSVTVIGIAFVMEFYHWLVTKLEVPLAKWLTGVVTVMAAAIATGAASSTLATATGQDPVIFKTSTAFLAPLAFVPIFATLIMIGAFFALPIFILREFAKHGLTVGKPKEFDMLLSVARAIGLVVVASAAAQLVSPATRLNEGLEITARYGAFFLDMVPDRTCAPTVGDRVARINDSLVVIGRLTNDGLQFVRTECAIAAQSTVLRPPQMQQASKSTTALE